jgi:branched-chain amino acid transport system permease protein
MDRAGVARRGRGYADDQTFRNLRPAGGILMRQFPWIDALGGLLVLGILALVPMLATSNYLTGVLTVCAIYGIWASSWDFMSGLTGRENFGHALFIGSGAYTAGFTAHR